MWSLWQDQKEEFQNKQLRFWSKVISSAVENTIQNPAAGMLLDMVYQSVFFRETEPIIHRTYL